MEKRLWRFIKECINMGNRILFMTACINPNGMSNTALQNVEERKRQYVYAIEYYLSHTDFQILFVENSGYDISSLFECAISSGRVEMLTYEGNHFDKGLGKGYGEGLIMRHALSHSKILKDDSIIIKVSGRHIVKNINLIVSLTSMFSNCRQVVACDVNPKTRGANSDMFIGTMDFYRFFDKYVEDINERENIWFEHVLYAAIVDFCKEKGNFVFLPLPLNQEGVSGSMGTKFKRPSCSLYMKHFLKALLYKFGIRRI